MRLSNVILRVSDMETSVGFWRDQVGLEVTMSGGEFIFLNGEPPLVLHRPERFEPQSSQTEIVFEVDDVSSAFDEMRGRGVLFELDPRPLTVDGTRTLLGTHFRDPDGHLASITGWVDEVE